ncbi:unnamed protein product [Symbiodinium sp. CCMP2592]|nr:unnamed protein product [Symbiodinium sp. CCMP2592]
MASQTRCVWAAPVRRQMPLHAQPGTSTYVWPWPSAPIVVRRTIRIVARPVAPAQVQLPHLLRRRSWATSPEPPKNPKTRAPPKGEPPMICVAATPVRHPSKPAIPETAATPPAHQAPVPPPEPEHAKGPPVSFFPETPEGGEEDHEQKKEDEETAEDHEQKKEDEEANDEPQHPSPRLAEAAKAEPPHAQFGEAELEALMADLAAMGIQVPEKPKGEAEVGDLIVLGANIYPKEFRLRYAVVMEVEATHLTVWPLLEDRATGMGECWPYKVDTTLESTVGRLGGRVRVAQGPHAGCVGTVVAVPGVRFPLFQELRNHRMQYVIKVAFDDGRDELFLFTELQAEC